jgi:hypothetical protein
MGTTTIKRTMITALAAGAAGAPAAWGMSPNTLATGDPVYPAPPPSSMAMSAADEYAELRAAAAAGHREIQGTQPAVDEPAVAEAVSSGGLDVPSAAIGGAGMGLVVILAAGALAWRRPERTARA